MIDLHAEHQKLLALHAKRERRLFETSGYIAPVNNLVLAIKALPGVRDVYASVGTEAFGWDQKAGAAYVLLSIYMKEHDWAPMCEAARLVHAAMMKAAADRGEVLVFEGVNPQIDAIENACAVHRRVDIAVRNRAGHMFRFCCTMQMPKEMPRTVSSTPHPVSGIEAVRQIEEMSDAEIDGILAPGGAYDDLDDLILF